MNAFFLLKGLRVDMSSMSTLNPFNISCQGRILFFQVHGVNRSAPQKIDWFRGVKPPNGGALHL
jgi:hypothetical protein